MKETNESYEKVMDLRERSDYEQDKFNVCEAVAKEYLATKERIKGYNFTCYDLRFDLEDEIESDTYLRLTDEQVTSLKAYMIDTYNTMYLETPVKTWEEFDSECMETVDEDYWNQLNSTPGIWKEWVSDNLESQELRPKKVDFNDWNYGYQFSCFIYDEEKKEMAGPCYFRFHLTDEEYVFLLALQLSEHQGFTYNRLTGINPKLVARLNSCVEMKFLEIENQFNYTQPFTIIFDEIIEDASLLQEKKDKALKDLGIDYIHNLPEIDEL